MVLCKSENNMPGVDTSSTTRGFRVQQTEAEDCLVVECFGKLVSENVPALKQAMLDACTKKRRIILDLKEVPMIDSSGLGAVVTLHVSARTRGCKLEVVNARQQVRDLFSMTNLLSLFEAAGRCGGRMG
jgi:anti-anti-sigma factor